MFRNGVAAGIYKVDLGRVREVTAVNTWSFNQNGDRGSQYFLLYGSDLAADPGWDVSERKKFLPIIEVDTTKFSGPEDNEFGVVCRYQNEDNFYYFVISSDGYHSINKFSSGEYVILGDGAYQFNSTIRQSEGLNHIRAWCVGDTLRLDVNGRTLAQVQDSDFLSGEIGMIAGSYDESGVEIQFDHFTVYSP